MRAVVLLPLVVCFIARSAGAQPSGPFVDVAVGVGHGAQSIRSDTSSTHDFDGIAGLLEARVISATGHGGGLRIGGVGQVSLFGGKREDLFTLDAHYVYRAVGPRGGFHLVPTVYVGPSYQRQSASYQEECFLGCSYSPPADLHAYDHQALGMSAGASLDFHFGRGFAGLDVSGRYALPLDNERIRSASGYALMLRLGVTLGATEPAKAR